LTYRGMTDRAALPDGMRSVVGEHLIEGVQVIPLRRIPDERGTIFHMLRRDDSHFLEFGEIYFTSVYRDAIKAWHKHRDMTLNYACIFGRVKLALYDDREGSPTRGSVTEIFLGPDNYVLVSISPGIWSGFKGMSDPYAIVANCCTHPHDPARTTRVDPFENDIPYDWAAKHS
jgi:dTDP-4-dehydrorhamnose 3,5-epimerase